MSINRFLFLVKYREAYDGSCGYDGTYQCIGGLYYSALFVARMLASHGVPAKVVQVCDNNDIDREVAKYQPTHVIIEALWVVPEKFAILTRLHPTVQWMVRSHSEIPFLALEGIAIDWLVRYVQLKNVAIANNSPYATRDFTAIIQNANPAWSAQMVSEKVLYLPNFYPMIEQPEPKSPTDSLNIGCFGAIRPLKNQLIQALAAVQFAATVSSKKRRLRFHVNRRDEQHGQNILKNIRALVTDCGQELVEHPWEKREDFLDTLSQMDVSMQVSFSETFNIVAADSVSLGIPLVGSEEITWSSKLSHAVATNTASIVAALKRVTGHLSEEIRNNNLLRLRVFCNESTAVWLRLAL